MSSWELVPCLVALRDEFNQLAPNRDKSSDGSIGDEAHQSRSSDHNPDDTPGSKTPQTDSDSNPDVRGLDVDQTGKWPSPMTFDLAIEEIRKRHKDGRDNRLVLLIWNRRKTGPDYGWNWVDYTGDNAHTEHGHFSASSNSSKEADTSPWGLVEKWGDMALSSDDKKYLRSLFDEFVGDVVQRYDTNGEPITGTDNDTMFVSSGVGYNGRDIKWILKDLAEVKAQLAALTAQPAASKASRSAAK